ncbi:MAG: nitroreductase family protein [Paludibacteraceae bacterium]|nr:nitroreductase family protein [Paludibacteraceae bacterium]MBR1923319.1 nitroreductase family protein [Paludibacteraceae bacterium]
MKKTLFILTLTAMIISCTCQSEQNINSALDVINTRVSVRQFTGEKLSSAQIDTILRAGMAAPTAVNKQPWAFVVVEDAAQLAALSRALPSSRIENGASHAIVVCGDMTKALEGEAQGYWVEDTSAATENMLLAAHAMGLGGLWVGVYPIAEKVKRVSDIIAAPEYIVPMCLVVLGVPNEQPAVKDKYKPENIHFNRW